MIFLLDFFDIGTLSTDDKSNRIFAYSELHLVTIPIIVVVLLTSIVPIVSMTRGITSATMMALLLQKNFFCSFIKKSQFFSTISRLQKQIIKILRKKKKKPMIDLLAVDLHPNHRIYFDGFVPVPVLHSLMQKAFLRHPNRSSFLFNLLNYATKNFPQSFFQLSY